MLKAFQLVAQAAFYGAGVVTGHVIATLPGTGRFCDLFVERYG